MCYFGGSSTRQEPITTENKIKLAGPTSGASSMTDNINLDSDIQRRQRALRLSNNNSGGGVMV